MQNMGARIIRTIGDVREWISVCFTRVRRPEATKAQIFPSLTTSNILPSRTETLCAATAKMAKNRAMQMPNKCFNLSLTH